MMNKALEVIEAHWLFGLEPARIRVVVHPQSIIHSMVVCRDGSVLAQLGTPDMRVPIAFGLSFPERIESGAARLDFDALAALTFEAPDRRRFPGLQLAWDTLQAAPGATAVLNGPTRKRWPRFSTTASASPPSTKSTRAPSMRSPRASAGGFGR